MLSFSTFYLCLYLNLYLARALIIEPPCDILIAGGSLSSLAAAISAANSSLSLSTQSSLSQVCLLEITDWIGGQITSSGTSAIDLGETWTNFPDNFPQVFANFLTSSALGPTNTNPGGCTVSTKCFLPLDFVTWANKLLITFNNLRVYRSTAVISVERERKDESGRVTSLTAVRRTPTAAHLSGYDRPLSESLLDWYSTSNSEYFDKEILEFTIPQSGVVIEATEFGDVLLLGQLNVTQGAEVDETSVLNTLQTCGQAATICFWTSWDENPMPSPDPWPIGWPGNALMSNTTKWELSSLVHTLTWRRSFATNNSDSTTVRQGDISLINAAEGNDEVDAYMFLTIAEARATAALGTYAGGIDLFALKMSEARAFAFYHAIVNSTPRLLPTSTGYFGLNASTAGTQYGLAKLPYLRDSRRASSGILSFRLCHHFAAHDNPNPGPLGCYNGDGSAAEEEELSSKSSTPVGYHWHDTIALGSYGFDQHRLENSTCVLPQYLQYGGLPGPSLPYYLPWRALTVGDATNLLVSGKNMAQSFYANSVTRLHPSEWSSGAAAGAGAALMVHYNWTSLDVYRVLQKLVNSSVVGLPIDWTL